MRAQLERDHLTIGRLATNDIALPYPHISRQHAELRLMGQTWWVVDLHSTNGLHVGGQRVSECKLNAGVHVMLSPLITLNLLDERPLNTPSYPQQPPAQPPVSYAPAPAREPVRPLSALGPRSPYADDEAPFYPQMRPPSAPAYNAPAAQAPFAPTSMGAHPGYYPAQSAPSHGSGSTVRPGEMSSSALDPQRQANHIFEQRRTAGVSPSPLLHVCQTCGQRTSPDAVYCQNCHHAIASECVRCRLSLLPIQDLCPRCQTPNPASVRRLRPAGARW